MSLSQKVQAIEEVFLLLDQELATFRDWSGLSCKSGCGKCCTKPDIEATVLEFIPFAHHIYQLGLIDEWLEKFSDDTHTKEKSVTHSVTEETPSKSPDNICFFFNPHSVTGGLCSQYPHRGLICRLFGFSARTNKYAKPEFVTCQTMKTEQADAYTHAVKSIEGGAGVPVISQYYMRLHAIDPDLAQKFYPVNEAIRRAIHVVLHYYAYRS